jgi:hypothetical protein
MDSAEHDELVTIRTQLTVALLAVTQLQRRHTDSADADRLLAYVSTALARITREVCKIDRLMARLEDREAMRANPVRLRTRRHTGDDQERREHGEPLQRHAKTTDSRSTAI